MLDFETKVDGGSGTSGQEAAAEFNNYIDELKGSVTDSGQTLDNTGADITQLGTSLSIHAAGSDFFTAANTNAYVLSVLVSPSFRSPIAYFTGMRIRTSIGNPNTSSTVTVDVSGLGVKSVKKNGVDPQIGDLDGFVEMVYDGTNFEIMALQKLQSLNPKAIAVAAGSITSDGAGAQDISNTFGVSDCTINGGTDAFEFTLSTALSNQSDMYGNSTAPTAIVGLSGAFSPISASTFQTAMIITSTGVADTTAGLIFSFQVFDIAA